MNYLKQYYNLEVLEVCLLGSSIPPNEFFDLVQAWVYGFAIFAFLLNLIREIQKDLADIVGDKDDGRISIPIKYGEQLSKVLVLLLMMLSILLVALAYKYFISNSMHLFYFLGFLIIPLSISGVFTFRASQRKDYLVAANISKLVMFFGILYAAVIYYSTL